MPAQKQIPYQYGIFFITFTCYRWMHLFDIANSYDLVYKWFDHLKSKGNYILSYVIMPNHAHMLIGLRNNGKNLNSIVGNGKRFMAYRIVDRLRASGNEQLLQQLAAGVNVTDSKRESSMRYGRIPSIGKNAAAKR